MSYRVKEFDYDTGKWVIHEAPDRKAVDYFLDMLFRYEVDPQDILIFDTTTGKEVSASEFLNTQSKMQHVFVYGTLRKGYQNDRLLKNSKFLGKGKTKQKYVLKSSINIYFPWVYEKPANVPITGEIYQVDEMTFRGLDRLEGYPHMYLRKEVDVILDSGKIIKAWMYFLRKPLQKEEYEIETGDFADDMKFKKRVG